MLVPPCNWLGSAVIQLAVSSGCPVSSAVGSTSRERKKEKRKAGKEERVVVVGAKTGKKAVFLSSAVQLTGEGGSE
eukprot:COSAG02_NODE_1025_length_15146_cov_21.959460_3_plen_76_part_00